MHCGGGSGDGGSMCTPEAVSRLLDVFASWSISCRKSSSWKVVIGSRYSGIPDACV